MKVFWLLITMIVAAAGVLAYAQQERGPEKRADAAATDTETEAPAQAETPQARSTPDDGNTTGSDSGAAAPSVEPDAATDGESQTEAPAVADADGQNEQAEPENGDEAATEEQLDPTAMAAALFGSSESRMKEDGEGLNDPATMKTSETSESASGEIVGAGAPTDTVEEQPDGSLLAGGRWVITGSGAKADPYNITWDMLVSVSETYRPKQGMTDMPEYVSMLNEKWVKITGYVAYPAAAGQVSELLVMLNQWDGCCVGVPPSVYDSIEARLTEPMDPWASTVAPYGTVRGKLLVDPYFVNEWLVGLYLMEETSLDLDF